MINKVFTTENEFIIPENFKPQNGEKIEIVIKGQVLTTTNQIIRNSDDKEEKCVIVRLDTNKVALVRIIESDIKPV